jgi:hypothetical protein
MRTYIGVVNEVGVDINHAVQHKFAAGPLQFTAGLGPRKAQALLQALERKVPPPPHTALPTTSHRHERRALSAAAAAYRVCV